MKKYILILLILNLSNSIFSQTNNSARGAGNFSYEDKTLEEVIFYRPIDITKWIDIYKDPSKNPDPIKLITLSSFSDKADQSIAYTLNITRPVAYVSNCKGVVSAKFNAKCEDTKFYVRGVGTDGFNLPAKQVTVKNGIFEYPKTEFEKKFDSLKVRYFPEFMINWEFSDKIDGNFISIGESKHPLYIVHKLPQNIEPIIHSFLFISCDAANNLSNEDQILNTIFDKIKTKEVKKYGGKRSLAYWALPATSRPPQDNGNLAFTAMALVAYGNATCGNWAALHEELLRIQGLKTLVGTKVSWTPTEELEKKHLDDYKIDLNNFFDTLKNNVIFYPDPKDPSIQRKYADFYVKNYNFVNGVKTFYLAENDPIAQLDVNGKILVKANENGIGGQGNQDPRSYFQNHQIVKNTKDNKYYDPSYGAGGFMDSKEWSTNSIAGFGTRLILNYKLNNIPRQFEIIWAGYNANQQNIIFN